MGYDLIILGGGPGGYNAAERAADANMRTLVIERAALGGVCLNEGCIPTKTFLYSAKLLDGAKHGEKYGVTVAEATLDQKKVVTRKTKVVRTLVSGIRQALKARGVDVVTGEGRILSRNGDEFVVGANGEEYTAPKLLIATGSSPVMPPIPGAAEAFEAGRLMTNREALDITSCPERFIVIGGGVIGLEMASYFNSAGAQVTVVEMLDHIGGGSDTELAGILQRNYEARGIRFMLNTKAVQFTDTALIVEHDGETDELEFDKALMSVGRRANTADLGLEEIGVITERGAIVTDEKMRTNVPGVYAAGDVNGRSMLAHTAYREGEVAINCMLGRDDAMNYDRIPAVIYTNPELSSVGLTEAEALRRGIDHRVVKLNMRFSGRYLAENEGGDGIFKLVVDNNTEQVLGAHALTNHSSEFIVSVGVMMEAGMTLDMIRKVVFPHPTVCEIIREAVFHG